MMFDTSFGAKWKFGVLARSRARYLRKVNVREVGWHCSLHAQRQVSTNDFKLGDVARWQGILQIGLSFECCGLPKQAGGGHPMGLA